MQPCLGVERWRRGSIVRGRRRTSKACAHAIQPRFEQRALGASGQLASSCCYCNTLVAQAQYRASNRRSLLVQSWGIEPMDDTISIGLLLLLVINLGVVVGAGFYEMRVVVPLWASAPPRSLLAPESGLSFWMYVTTGPLTLLTLGNAVAAWETTSAARTWWLIAVIIVALKR